MFSHGDSALARPLIILGAGGNAQDVLDVVERINAVKPAWEMLGFLDDGRRPGTRYLGYEVIGPLDRARNVESDVCFISSIWNSSTFTSVDKVLEATGLEASRFATLVHPGAAVSSRAELGRNVLVHFGSSVAGGVRILDHVSIGPGCLIGHGTCVGSFTTVAAGAVVAGDVQIERNCYVGSGVAIREHVRIGERSLIGLGAVVVKNISPDTTVIGNPARPRAYLQQRFQLKGGNAAC